MDDASTMPEPRTSARSYRDRVSNVEDERGTGGGGDGFPVGVGDNSFGEPDAGAGCDYGAGGAEAAGFEADFLR
jgi:hypothetical protein